MLLVQWHHRHVACLVLALCLSTGCIVSVVQQNGLLFSDHKEFCRRRTCSRDTNLAASHNLAWIITMHLVAALLHPCCWHHTNLAPLQHQHHQLHTAAPHFVITRAESAIINCTPVDINSNPAPKRFARQTCKLQTKSFDHMHLVNSGYVQCTCIWTLFRRNYGWMITRKKTIMVGCVRAASLLFWFCCTLGLMKKILTTI